MLFTIFFHFFFIFFQNEAKTAKNRPLQHPHTIPSADKHLPTP